jgi:multicomponent K+:H+ antiporter subunit A
LTSAYFYIELPLLGKIPIASAMLFEIGVFFTVAGAALLLISVLGDSRHSTLSGPVLREDT